MAASLQSELAPALSEGVLSDLQHVSKEKLSHPQSIAHWTSFAYKLYSSETATRILRKQLDNNCPGTSASYAQIIAAVQGTGAFCFLVGGQVRDIIRGKLSSDTDFNYSCPAQKVAAVCVENEWAVKYKPIGVKESFKPNYVLIGDESSDAYLEGFSLDFNASSPSSHGDLRQNLLFYDLANDVILDKTGHGCEDIRSHALRLPCDVPGDPTADETTAADAKAADATADDAVADPTAAIGEKPTNPAASSRPELFAEWAANDITHGLKSLRYVKFFVRAAISGAAPRLADDECAFVVATLRAALSDNADAMRGFWFDYCMKDALSTAEGVAVLRRWVTERGGSDWWVQWQPYVEAAAPRSALGQDRPVPTPPPARRRGWSLSLSCCGGAAQKVGTESECLDEAVRV